MRATASTGPPADDGTISRTVREGNFAGSSAWAWARPRPLSNSSAATKKCRTGMSAPTFDRNEQVIGRHRRGDQGLLVQILHQRIERRPVRLDAIREGITA